MIRINHPIALVVTLAVVLGAVAVLDPGLVGLRDTPADAELSALDPTAQSGTDLTEDDGTIIAERRYNETPRRIKQKRGKYSRAIEIQEPTGFINTESINLSQYIGERVILLEFWTYCCYNCQNTHPHIQNYWRTYRDEGLIVIGIHYPEFEHERKRANVVEYVNETNTTYPIVLDNDRGTWGAYDQRYWPTRYLIGVDGFIRYKHIGEGGYDETDAKIQKLLRERDRVLRQQNASTLGGL